MLIVFVFVMLGVDCWNIESFLVMGRRSGGLEGRAGLRGRRLE
jgi:hypothetical protein